MSMCVYCRSSSPEVTFSREHVLPQAFGKFKGALTLLTEVCSSCNQFFATTLDYELSRKAIEGLERYRWGVKEPKEIEKFKFDHIQLRAAEEGDFRGAPVELYHNVELDKVLAKPRPGVAVHNIEDDEFTHFTPTEIETGVWQQAAVDWRRGIKIFGPEEVVNRLRKILAEQGVKPKQFRPLLPPNRDVQIEQEFEVTLMMKRAVAKIAFNYLTKRQGGAFALLDQFDPIRRFIRYGEPTSLPPIDSTLDLPFRSNAPLDKRPVVHWVEITGHESHSNLLGKVMLFGYMNHVVMLAEDFLGPWPELPAAHLYNPKTLVVSEMVPATPRWKHADRIHD